MLRIAPSTGTQVSSSRVRIDSPPASAIAQKIREEPAAHPPVPAVTRRTLFSNFCHLTRRFSLAPNFVISKLQKDLVRTPVEESNSRGRLARAARTHRETLVSSCSELEAPQFRCIPALAARAIASVGICGVSQRLEWVARHGIPSALLFPDERAGDGCRNFVPGFVRQRVVRHDGSDP